MHATTQEVKALKNKASTINSQNINQEIDTQVTFIKEINI